MCSPGIEQELTEQLPLGRCQATKPRAAISTYRAFLRECITELTTQPGEVFPGLLAEGRIIL